MLKNEELQRQKKITINKQDNDKLQKEVTKTFQLDIYQ